MTDWAYFKHITNSDRPADVTRYRKTAITGLQWVNYPFTVQTQEGTTYVVDEATEAWEGGYFIAWPEDGSEPYPVSPKFVRDNYEPVDNATKAGES